MRVLLYQSPQFRDVLSFFLTSSSCRVVGIINKLQELDHTLYVGQPDVALLDMSLPHATEILNKIKRKQQSVKVIALTNDAELKTLIESLKMGIDGYILINKTTLPRILDYVRDALEGGIPISSDLIGQVFKSMLTSTTDNNVCQLTKREYQILHLLVNGCSYKGVSFTLNIAIDTVRSHIKKIYEKLNVNSKSEAVATALKNKMVII